MRFKPHHSQLFSVPHQLTSPCLPSSPNHYQSSVGNVPVKTMSSLPFTCPHFCSYFPSDLDLIILAFFLSHRQHFRKCDQYLLQKKPDFNHCFLPMTRKYTSCGLHNITVTSLILQIVLSKAGHGVS